MKATGIVRRIDELGRVVIPKEIRRTMKIKEGSPLEIYTDGDGEVIFKKYSPIGEMTSFAAQYAETLYKTCDLSVVICDRDSVIAAAGVSKKDYSERPISDVAENIMEGRSFFTYRNDKRFGIAKGVESTHFVSCLAPIITEGDVVGCVASVFPASEADRHRAGEIEQKLIRTAADFLSRQMDV